jgi:hypothetical protein
LLSPTSSSFFRGGLFPKPRLEHHPPSRVRPIPDELVSKQEVTWPQTESLVLSLSGSLLGMAFARFIVPVILTSSPIDLPQLQKAQIDLPVATFAIAIGCVTTLFFGLLPALNAFREGSGSQLGNARAAEESALGSGLVNI